MRVDRLAESVRIVRAMLDGEEVTFTGQHYRLTEHQGWPVLDLTIGAPPGRGERAAGPHHRLPARDIVGFIGFSHDRGGTRREPLSFQREGLARQVELVKERGGRPLRPARANALLQRVIVTDDRRSAAERLAADWGLLTTDEVLDSPFLLIGTAQQMAEQLVERRERFGISYWVSLAERPWADQRIETLAPVIELLPRLAMTWRRNAAELVDASQRSTSRLAVQNSTDRTSMPKRAASSAASPSPVADSRSS